MRYTILELMYLFILYSFIGWVMETTATAVKMRSFTNRGLVNGPFCIIYGMAAVFVSVCMVDLPVFWIFVGGMILATLLEWIGGHWIESRYHEKWWDYSNVPLNLDGYICAPMSVCWGTFAVIVAKIGNLLFCRVFHLLPSLVGNLIVFILWGILILDIAATMIILSGRSKAKERWQSVDEWLTGISNRFGKWICRRVDFRIKKAYPKSREIIDFTTEKTENVFAAGCCFDKLFLIFFITSFLGDVVETVFCRANMGVWMSRSSLVWGDFSVVWGFAIAVFTAVLYKYKDRSSTFLFVVGTLLGGTYEYVCSVLSEIVFGKVFWDYSAMPFNLGGRINLLYSFFWGFAAVIWFKLLFVWVSRWIEKIPVRVGKVITRVLVVFMAANMAVSALALIRYDERDREIPASAFWQEWLDENYNDEKMARIYPMAKSEMGVKVELPVSE
ncbi:MAG: putative ABC transporter permease [Clostridiales bacterium]|nr:putative ABC transporter permease [Clostridiales bacterium]